MDSTKVQELLSAMLAKAEAERNNYRLSAQVEDLSMFYNAGFMTAEQVERYAKLKGEYY